MPAPHFVPRRRCLRPAAGLAWALLLLVPLVPACGKRVAVPRAPADVPGYLTAPPRLAGIDPAPLVGRRILIDPGHGGRFPGAIGHEGLTEAEVNLGVALYLHGMLRWAGADVHLTRTADVDFLTAADTSLAADLAARVAICDSLQPDVFLSIHHNSTPGRDPTINETQTYYPLGREGADLDLAQSIHRRLVLALGIEPARILPGGFHVLRNVSVPAVLGEPAMLSNPVIEGRLTLARSLELEASAYFLGLLDYFAAGTPRWLTALPDTIDLAALPGPLAWRFDGGSPAAPLLDPATIALTCDGAPLTAQWDPAAAAVWLLPHDLPDGGRLSLAGRNLAGRATPARDHVLVRSRSGPWRLLHVADPPGASPRRALLTWTSEGRDLRDGPPLRLEGAGAEPQPLPSFAGPRGWTMLERAVAEPQRLRLAERTPVGAWQISDGPTPEVATLPAGWRWRFVDRDRAVWPLQAVPAGGWRLRLEPGDGELATSGVPAELIDPRWPAVPWPDGRSLWLEASGARPLYLAGDEMAAGEALAWEPLLPALVGRRVAIDPRGGGDQEQGRGPLGTRGSDLNLHAARRLAALLRGLGGEVLVLRDDETWLPDPERVRRADRFGAEFYLALARGEPAVRHHPNSRTGEPWSAHTAAALAALLPDSVRTVPAWDYVLRHTACPALVAVLEEPTTAPLEERLTAPAWQDAEARALLRGLVALLEPDAAVLDLPALLAVLGERALAPPRLAYARLDGNLTWLAPGPVGTTPAAFPRTGDPGLPGRGGRHFLELHAGPEWQLWTLVRRPGGDWHGQLLRENR